MTELKVVDDYLGEVKDILDRATIEEKVVRHVRTREGERRFGQPIGSIIVADRKLSNVTISPKQSYSDWTTVQDKHGNEFNVGQYEDGSWVVMDAREDPIIEAPTEDSVYKKLDQHATTTKAPAKPTAKKGTAAKPKTVYVNGRKLTPAQQKLRQHGGTTKHLPKRFKSLPDNPNPPKNNKERQRYVDMGIVIPPAWTGVTVPDDEALKDSHILARGYDQFGVPQAIYSLHFREQQDDIKFRRMMTLHELFDDQKEKQLAKDAMEDDAAAAVLLMRRLGIRVSTGAETSSTKKAYGATTLESRHVTINGNTATLEFDAKSGKVYKIKTNDPDVVAMLKSAKAGKRGNTRLFDVTANEAQDYLNNLIPSQGGAKWKNHDLRTIVANLVAMEAISKVGRKKPKNLKEYEAMRNRIGDLVAEVINDTRTVALNSYINPAVFDVFGLEGLLSAQSE